VRAEAACNQASLTTLCRAAYRWPGTWKEVVVMLYLITNWFLSALSIIIVAHLIPGFQVRSFGTALIAAVVIGLVNATIGIFVKLLTLPLTVLTFGLFLLVVNALMLLFASSLVPGFVVAGFLPAFFGAIVLSLINTVLRELVFGA
jgi:putative membrane protein